MSVNNNNNLESSIGTKLPIFELQYNSNEWWKPINDIDLSKSLIDIIQDSFGSVENLIKDCFIKLEDYLLCVRYNDKYGNPIDTQFALTESYNKIDFNSYHTVSRCVREEIGYNMDWNLIESKYFIDGYSKKLEIFTYNLNRYDQRYWPIKNIDGIIKARCKKDDDMYKVMILIHGKLNDMKNLMPYYNFTTEYYKNSDVNAISSLILYPVARLNEF